MSAAPPGFAVRRLDSVGEAEIGQLAAVLTNCVEGGASVGFMLPLEASRARAFWRRIAADVAARRRLLLVAEDAAGIAGTVQLVLDLPENQPHRADLAKMLVHRRARGMGVGAALLAAAEDAARAEGRNLLVLDTATGSDAERLYRRLGWSFAGTIPGYALWPGGGLCATSFFHRRLD